MLVYQMCADDDGGGDGVGGALLIQIIFNTFSSFKYYNK
jgi:hypothetical protein